LIFELRLCEHEHNINTRGKHHISRATLREAKSNEINKRLCVIKTGRQMKLIKDFGLAKKIGVY
jgi:hypothetical protein